MTQEENQTEEPEESFDPHRFSAEPKRKPNKTIVVILVIFVMVMTLLGASVYITKKYLSTFMSERAEKRAEEKLKKEAEEDNGRKNKQFAEIPVALPALPVALKGQEGEPTADGAIPLVPLGETAAKAPPAPPPPPGLMDDEAVLETGNANGAVPVTSGLLGTATSGPRARNVQELAQQQSQQAPLTSTQQVSAENLGNRSYLLARGAFIPCVLETQLISNIGGSSSCVLPQNIYSDDGKVMLLEKGSTLVGQYQSNLKNGDVRIAILWQRIKTATGVVIDVDSPAADQVGVMGAAGYVDNHWFERIGAAFLLSLVDSAVKIQVAQESRGGTTNSPSYASPDTTSSLAGKVLDSTINIPPTMYKNRGDRLMVYVNRDLWFNNVYKLTQR